MNNDRLVEQMLATGYLSSGRIANAFRAVDREDFVDEANQDFAYEDRPLPIGRGQTISQPSTVAFMLEQLAPEPGNIILDVGTGSGWTTALLAHLVSPNGQVLGIEIITELVDFGQKNLAKYHFANAAIQKASKEVGAPEEGPFDRILVSAAADSIPTALIDQLKAGGTLVIPIKNSIEVVKKAEDGSLTQESHYGFSFVPLV